MGMALSPNLFGFRIDQFVRLVAVLLLCCAAWVLFALSGRDSDRDALRPFPEQAFMLPIWHDNADEPAAETSIEQIGGANGGPPREGRSLTVH
jgi:hypothetical protein